MGIPCCCTKKEGPPGSSCSCHCPLCSVSGILLKAVMAVTGLILFGFTIIHTIGNLLIFLPPDAINGYAYFLQHAGVHGITILWPFRAFMLATALIHIVSAIVLTKRNRAARPVEYAEMKANGATFASRTMFVGGLVLAVFIAFHLLQFTVQAGPFSHTRTYETAISSDDADLLKLVTVPPTHETPYVISVVHDVHRMVIEGFGNIWISCFYLIAVAVLGLHLNHGAAALFRSLGIGNRATFPWQNFIARAFGLFVFLGMAAVPLGVLSGIIK